MPCLTISVSRKALFRARYVLKNGQKDSSSRTEYPRDPPGETLDINNGHPQLTRPRQADLRVLICYSFPFLHIETISRHLEIGYSMLTSIDSDRLSPILTLRAASLSRFKPASTTMVPFKIPTIKKSDRVFAALWRMSAPLRASRRLVTYRTGLSGQYGPVIISSWID